MTLLQGRRPPTAAGTLIAVGSSAGGPSALAAVLGVLTPDFPAAIVIVQHVDSRFANDMATWLASETSLAVRIARDGDRPMAGSVLLAATDDHLVLTSASTLRYISEPRDTSYRPSVDVFFESVAKHWQGSAIGVVLTGMGRDGTSGLGALRTAGAVTIAQDRASSAVYGMPRAAAESGAADEVVPLDKIGARLVELLRTPPLPLRRTGHG